MYNMRVHSWDFKIASIYEIYQEFIFKSFKLKQILMIVSTRSSATASRTGRQLGAFNSS